MNAAALRELLEAIEDLITSLTKLPPRPNDARVKVLNRMKQILIETRKS